MAPADDAAGHFQKGFVDDGEALETHTQPLEVVQPSDRSFDDPAGLTKPTAMRLAAASDLRSNASGVQRLAVLVVVVSAITLDNGWL